MADDKTIPQLQDTPHVVNSLTLYKPLDAEEWAKADIIRKLRTDRFNCDLKLQAEAADKIEWLRKRERDLLNHIAYLEQYSG